MELGKKAMAKYRKGKSFLLSFLWPYRTGQDSFLRMKQYLEKVIRFFNCEYPNPVYLKKV